MKTILVLCGLILAGAIAWLVVARPWVRHYGSEFRGLAPVPVATLLDKPAEYLKKDVRIEGRVGRMCPQCGCWFVVMDAAGRELRVSSGDSAGCLPFRPGKTATAEGQLIPYGTGYQFIAESVEFR